MGVTEQDNLRLLPTTDTPVLEAALAYACIGWPVFPLSGKVPAISKKEGGQGYKDATTDEAQIRRWWARFPWANIGIACGFAGLVVIDITKDGWTAWRDLERKLRLGLTLMAQSGKGGTHAYYLAPPHAQVRNAQGLLGGHMDVRGVDGYIVAPPSIHPESERPYAWIELSRTQILPLPAALMRYLLTEQPIRRRRSYASVPAGRVPAGSVGPEQRFTRTHPCPICGGCANDARGQGRRCWGFLSADGAWAHCTREEYAGTIDRKPGSETFAHKLRGACACGVTHGRV